MNEIRFKSKVGGRPLLDVYDTFILYGKVWMVTGWDQKRMGSRGWRIDYRARPLADIYRRQGVWA